MSESTIKKIQSAVNPAQVSRGLATGIAIRKFANITGLVYFGTVNQVEDDYRLVRGITASNTHRDSHYSVGSLDGFDIALVTRRDTLHYPDKRKRKFEWTIMTIDTRTNYDIPHIFISHDKAREILLAKYTGLTPLVVGIHEPHNPEFTDQYAISAQIEHSIEVTSIITPEITNAIKSVFDSIAVEIEDNTVYLYLQNDIPTVHELERMAKHGMWLVEKLEESARRFQQRLDGNIV